MRFGCRRNWNAWKQEPRVQASQRWFILRLKSAPARIFNQYFYILLFRLSYQLKSDAEKKLKIYETEKIAFSILILGKSCTALDSWTKKIQRTLSLFGELLGYTKMSSSLLIPQASIKIIAESQQQNLFGH